MHTLNPADCLAIVIAAGVTLYVGCRIIKRLTDWVIAAVHDRTRFEG